MRSTRHHRYKYISFCCMFRQANAYPENFKKLGCDFYSPTQILTPGTIKGNSPRFPEM